MAGDFNLSSMYNGIGGVEKGGFNIESASQMGGSQKTEAKAAAISALFTSVISAVGATKVGKLQEKQLKYAERARRYEKELRTAQRMTAFGEQSELRRRAKESAVVDSQLSQAVSGFKREGTAMASEALSERNYSEDEGAARRSLVSEEAADEYATRGDIYAIKGKRKQMRTERRIQQNESLGKMFGLGSDVAEAFK